MCKARVAQGWPEGGGMHRPVLRWWAVMPTSRQRSNPRSHKSSAIRHLRPRWLCGSCAPSCPEIRPMTPLGEPVSVEVSGNMRTACSFSSGGYFFGGGFAGTTQSFPSSGSLHNSQGDSHRLRRDHHLGTSRRDRTSSSHLTSRAVGCLALVHVGLKPNCLTCRIGTLFNCPEGCDTYGRLG
jgi:hypothetical protein